VLPGAARTSRTPVATPLAESSVCVSYINAYDDVTSGRENVSWLSSRRRLQRAAESGLGHSTRVT